MAATATATHGKWGQCVLQNEQSARKAEQQQQEEEEEQKDEDEAEVEEAH